MNDKLLEDILQELRKLNESLSAQRIATFNVDSKAPKTTYEYLLQKYGTTLTWQQAAAETGMFWQTIQMKCRTGEIKTPKNGYRWILTVKALAEFLDNTSSKQPDPMPVQLARNGHPKIV